MARLCSVCGHELPSDARAGVEYCSPRCKQKAYRLRKAKGEQPRAKTRAKPSPALDRREFERMMDDGMEDVLRHTRDILRRALDNPDTRASDLPALSRQYIAVCRELESQSGGGLFDDPENETTEVSDVGAEVV
ncbi:hypothetical protein Uis1B_0558 [Bifidobacterium margollesii]|uniref:Uncharacterized protein n=1 Tax=Bifidobacterium margollesii TaxID=2020964 RepID=A0A2N5JBI1_9BIFI|nr:hypothetical protein [Bifidobacterium margollesii]PLS31567.1 hypothetical protein Uis1B_0558 [Bifidobacterium margollesii]